MKLGEVFDSPYLQKPNPKNRKTKQLRALLKRLKKRSAPISSRRVAKDYPHGGGMFSGMF